MLKLQLVQLPSIHTTSCVCWVTIFKILFDTLVKRLCLWGYISLCIFRLIPLVNTEQKPLDDPPKLFYNMIFIHPSASIPDGPDLPSVFMAVFQIISSDMLSHFTHCISSGLSVWRTLSCAGLPYGCFSFNRSKVSLMIGKVPFCILLIRSLVAAFTFSLYIKLVIFLFLKYSATMTLFPKTSE